MLTLARYTLTCILRSPGILVWTLAFPIILSSVFFFMFAGIDALSEERAVGVAVVEDADAEGFAEFRSFLDEAGGEDGMLDVRYVADEREGAALLDDGTAEALVTIDDEGMPQMAVSAHYEQRSQTDRSIVRAVLDRYRQARIEAATLIEAATTGTAAVDPSRAQSAFSGGAVASRDAEVLRVEPDGYSRYYYALLGMASLMGAGIALNVVAKVRANCSNLGSRRQVGGISPVRQLAGAVAASWLASFACLLVAFAFMRGLGVEFGGRDGLALVALAACALVATGLGSLIGAIPHLGLGAKNGINTGIACILSIGAGLYGAPAMELADWLAANAPLASIVNPAAQVSEVFYDLAYYTTLEPFATTLAVLCAMAAALFLAAGILMRRQSYARL